jgi:predicted PurR-regulated permease PerM
MMAPQTERERLSVVIFYGAILLLGYLAYRILEPFIVPLAWAGVLALCAYPLFGKLEPRLGPTRSALLSTIAVALLLILPAVLLSLALINEAAQVVSVLQAAAADIENHDKLMTAWKWMQEHLPLPPVEQIKTRLIAYAAQLTTLVAAQAGVILQNTSIFLFKLFVALFALFFFLRDSKQLGVAVRQLLPFESSRKEQLISLTRDLVFAGTTTTLAVALAQGVAGGIGFAVLGIKAPVFWGVVMGFCALVPVFGTALIWLPTAAWLMITGGWIRGLILVGIGVGIVGMLDNVLRPALMSGRSSMNGLVIFVSLLGGVAAFGFIGLVLGPVVAALVISILQAGAAKEESNR